MNPHSIEGNGHCGHWLMPCRDLATPSHGLRGRRRTDPNDVARAHGLRGRRRTGRRGFGFYARVTGRSQVSSPRVALRQVALDSRSGVVSTIWLVLDSVDPGAGPLAPRLSLKDVTVASAESRTHAGPAQTTSRRGNECPPRQSRHDPTNHCSPGWMSPTTSPVSATQEPPQQAPSPLEARGASMVSPASGTGAGAGRSSGCMRYSARIFTRAGASPTITQYPHTLFHHGTQPIPRPPRPPRSKSPRGQTAPGGAARGRLSAEATATTFSDNRGARGPAPGSTESSASPIVLTAPARESSAPCLRATLGLDTWLRPVTRA
mgnify:CR=1 FL=1